MNEKIGEKLKSLRKAKSVTLKKLSESTGLSISYLSQVEREISSVTVNSLSKIVKALGAGMDYFLEPPESHEGCVMRGSEQSVMAVNGMSFYNRLSNDTMKNRALEPIIVNILPRSRHEKVEGACHEGEEFIYVLEGILSLFIENEQIQLYPGDSAHYDSTLPHECTNLTTKMVRLLTVSTPAIFNTRGGEKPPATTTETGGTKM